MKKSRLDIASLPKVTPSKLGQEHIRPPRRRPDRNGIPDPANPYRPKEDRPVLLAIVAAAWREHFTLLVPEDWRARTAEMLIAEFDRLFPAADMAVLDRYGCSRTVTALDVTVGHHQEFFELVVPRQAPGHVITFGRVSFYLDGAQPRPVPAAAEPYFEAIREAKAVKHDEFDRALTWTGWEVAQHRPPTWGQIEQVFPRIGAWMAAKREGS